MTNKRKLTIVEWLFMVFFLFAVTMMILSGYATYHFLMKLW